ncbi:dihydro-heme d1 dehydrogenase [Aquifex pyrophilus]
MPSLIALPLFVFFLFSFGKTEIYEKYCSPCHGKDRLGKTAPPLIPEFLKGKNLKKIIREGLSATGMPPFPNLTQEEINALISYITKPVKNVNYGLEEIKKSFQYLEEKPKNYEIKKFINITVAVDKSGFVYLLEGERLLDKFPMKYVHGGVKFSLKDYVFYVPSRDGWIISYDLKERRPLSKVRACVYLRNIALYGENVVAGCVLPKQLVVLSRALKPLKVIPLKGRISAIYTLYKRDALIVAYRDRREVGIFNKTLRSYPVEEPLQDYFIDPFENYIIGSSRDGKKVVIYRIEDFKKVYEEKTGSLPHLFAVSFWYRKGKFYMATRHRDGSLTLWELYNWKKIKTFRLKEKGFFVRTHFKNPYLWLDTYRNYVLLLNKKSLRLERIKVSEGGTFTHAEFSGDGNIAYLSVLGEGLELLDAYSFKKMKSYPLKYPVGKYNAILKSRSLYGAFLGYEVFMEKCWGCHHLKREAFAPPLEWIAKNRPKDLILSQILNPEKNYKLLGYTRNAMPRIRLSAYELEALMELFEALRKDLVE